MLEKDAIKKLFVILQARYGHKWTTAYDDSEVMAAAVNEWHRELRGFTPSCLRKGLESWRDAWPPTLPEFVTTCMPSLSELGFDVETETKRRCPDYHYQASNDHEESQRRKRYDEIRTDVEDEFQVEALRTVQSLGLERALEHTNTKELLI